MSLVEPEDVDGDIYDEISNLEHWQGMLSDLISNNDITQEEFDAEMLKCRYYLDIKTKTYILEDDDAEIIENLRKYKKSLTENYKLGTITEEEFNREYVKVLRKEYDILKMSESDEAGSKKIDEDLDLPLSEKLEKLHEAEMKYDKTVARKHGILFPKLPTGYSKEQVNEYYELKLKGAVDIIPELEDYIKKYNATKQLVYYYTTSFEVSKVFFNAETKKNNYEFKMVAPMSDKLNMKFLEKRSNLLLPEEQAYSDRLNILKDRMRQMSRADILKCASSRAVKFMSYIERLRENKQTVVKFKEHPKNYEMLKQIVDEENYKYYKIPSDKLFKDYVYTRPDINVDNQTTEYLETGNIGYLAIKPGSGLKDLGDGLENFVTVMPLEDELYTELKNKAGNKTEIDTVWQLRMSLPGSKAKNIVKRYLSFEEYLVDLKEILVDNSKMMSGTSRDIINAKIRKINFYLKYKEDPELYLPTGHTSVSNLFKNRAEIYKMRKTGMYKLLELITAYYPGAETLVEKLETDVFDYSSKNYDFNISKVLFLINNFQEKLEELINGNVSVIQLLAYETPKTLPEEDIDIRDDKQKSIDKLLAWKPDTNIYDRYRSVLKSLNYNFGKFKKDNPDLSNLELSQLMAQYSEEVQWNKALDNYKRLVVPDGYIELNFRLRHLLRQRNKLPSRRVFVLANISDRMKNQANFKATFGVCGILDPNEYAILTENIIYGLSKTPEDYIYYNDLVNAEYKKLCEYFAEADLKCELNDQGTVKCIAPFEPNTLIPVITNFLVTQGEFSNVDIRALKTFSEKVDSEAVVSYINSLRGAEIDAYNSVAMSQVNETPTSLNEIFLKAARQLKTDKFKEQLEKLAVVSYSTYKPPVVSTEKPIKIRHGKEFTPDYIKVGEYYIYGGHYPLFNTYDGNGNIVSENYTRQDLERLASVFNLDTLEDTFELYKSIVKFIQEYRHEDAVKPRLNFSPVENNTYYEYLKVPAKSIAYTYRPKLGVPEPGEVYTVVKDNVRIYGVPFKFTPDTIPVYSEDLKERVDAGFIIIEGPCVFEKTFAYDALTSDSYINIEYIDARGKGKIFREGVAPKRIKRKTEEMLNTCSRFSTRDACNNPNSYSLDVKGLKFKCKWLEEKCKGIIIESAELAAFDVSKVSYKDFSKNKLWEEAVNKSIRYVEELTKLKELSQDEIKTLTKEQKTRLLDYYKTLNEPKKILQSIPEEKAEIRNYIIIEKQADNLIPDNNVRIKKKAVEEGFTEFTIYELTASTIKFPMRNIRIGAEYTVNGNVVIPTEYFPADDAYTCEIKETGEIIVLEKEEFRKKSEEIVTKAVPIFCLVKNEDVQFLRGLPGYYWYNKKVMYFPDEEKLLKKEEMEFRTDVPTNFITPSSLLNGKPLISRGDILDAISKTAFSTLSTDDDNVYYITNKVNADKNAIDFAVKNKIDINAMFSKIIGTITLPDVIEEQEAKNPRKVISKTEITNIIQNAVDNRDKQTLTEHFVRAKKSKIDPELLRQAKDILKELLDEPAKPVPEPIAEIIPEPVAVKNIYTSSRRRR